MRRSATAYHIGYRRNEKISQNDRAERLIRAHKDAVYRQLYRMCGNRDDAEDVLVESLIKAVRTLDDLEEEESFRAWLAQIARRTCGRLKKREAMHPVLRLAKLEEAGFEPATTAEGADDRIIEQELKDCILRAFESLPDRYASVYRLRDIDGLTAESTAQELGLSVAAVKSRLHRARQMIRDRIECSM